MPKNITEIEGERLANLLLSSFTTQTTQFIANHNPAEIRMPVGRRGRGHG